MSTKTNFGQEITGHIFPSKHFLADEGSYFVTTNPTPGSSLLYMLQTAFSDTVPFLYLQNNDSGGGKNLYLDYIKLICTVSPASTTQAFSAVKIDGFRTVTTNHLSALAPVSPNTNVLAPSIASILVQNSTTASALSASSNASRLVSRTSAGGIPIAGDELVWEFGGDDFVDDPGTTATRAVPGREITVTCPIIIGPQMALTMYLWFPGNAATALQYEFEMGWFEK